MSRTSGHRGSPDGPISPSRSAISSACSRESPKVTLFKDVEPIADLLVEDAYDGMSGEKVTLAKTALLNSYFRLNATVEPVSGDRSWFSFVSRLVAIGRERFLAFVDPEMERTRS